MTPPTSGSRMPPLPVTSMGTTRPSALTMRKKLVAQALPRSKWSAGPATSSTNAVVTHSRSSGWTWSSIGVPRPVSRSIPVSRAMAWLP